MARRRKQSWEEKLLEIGITGGAAAGLISAASTASAPKSTRACSSAHTGSRPADCVSSALSHALTPYFKGAAVGAVAGVLICGLLIVTWKYMRGAKTGPFARRSPAHSPVRVAIPERVRHEVWRRDRGTCVDCGSRARLEFDHIIPVSRGGSNTVRNLEIRCEGCNRSKGARV